MASESEPSVTPAHDCWTKNPAPLPGAAQSGKGGRGELMVKLGTVVSALLASSCCWLPPILIVMGVSGAGMMQTIEQYRPLLGVVTFSFLGAAFYMTYRPRGGAVETCCEPAPAGTKRRFNMMAVNKVMLWGVTVMAVVFVFFPGVTAKLMGSGAATITADMHQTEVAVIGMTCDGWALTAKTAINSVPGVLAVEVDYESKKAIVGTEPGTEVPKEEILAALVDIGYGGTFVE